MVKLISITPDAEKIVGYCARVSSPHQDNPEIEKLLKYLIKHSHWSPFEQAFLTVEITTTRAISAQIIRHRSFSFQEFSQRYSPVQNVIYSEARRQDDKNRQNSVDDLDEDTKIWWRNMQEDLYKASQDLYNQALKKGIAKECARSVLPMSSETKLYMSGSLRSFIHYVNLRTEAGTQLEHREIAEEIKTLMIQELPVISKALGWTE